MLSSSQTSQRVSQTMSCAGDGKRANTKGSASSSLPDGDGLRAVTRASHHTYDCEWHHDQYPEECTCGAIREGSNGQGKA